MTKPKTTPKTKAIDRKRISEALLSDRLGLNEEWIERWEESGKIREEFHMPDRLPAFIQKNYEKGEIEEIESRIERLVAAGCRQQVVYFCLAQLSPEAKWFRAGGERTPVFRSGLKDTSVDADLFVPQQRRIATREDLEALANTAKAARKQIHRYQRELLLVAEGARYPMPVGMTSKPESAVDAVSLLTDSLTWAATLAEAYTAPMETTLLKSKGLLYLAFYVSMFAHGRKLRGSKMNGLLGDSSKPSDSACAQAEFVAGDPLTNLVNILAKEEEDKGWSPSELHRKLNDFEEDHPRLYKRMAEKLKELHDFASQ